MPVDIRKPLKKLLPVLLQAQRDNCNEADTVKLLIKLFSDVLGYDTITEITQEAHLKNKYVDFALKIDGAIKLLVEAKAAAVTLRNRHIEQAQGYAANNNYPWVLLTNGVAWNLYHLTFDQGIEAELALAVDLAQPDHLDEAAGLIANLHRNAIRKGELEAYWSKHSALSPASIGHALFHENVLRPLRRQIRKDTGLLIDPEDLAGELHKMLSPEAREQIGPLKIHKAHKPHPKPPQPKPALAANPSPEQHKPEVIGSGKA